MSNRLKLILSALIIFIGTLSAQTEKPIRFGVVGGVNFSNVKFDLGTRTGFHAGVKVEYGLPHNFYLESGLLFTQKGYDYKSTYYEPFIYEPEGKEPQTLLVQYKEKVKTYKNMLELPIHVGYRFNVHSDVKLFASVGGYLGYGLSGKVKGSYESNHQFPQGEVVISDFPENEKGGAKYNIYDVEKRFDWGLGAKVGVELFNKLQVSASYDWGINKLNSGGSEGNNRNLMVSCAFMFW